MKSKELIFNTDDYPSIPAEFQDYFGAYKDADTESVNKETIHELPKTGDVDASHTNFRYYINLLKNKLMILLN